MTYLNAYTPVATVMICSVSCTGFRAEDIVARGVITISTDSWLNRHASKVEKLTSRRRHVNCACHKRLQVKPRR